MGDGRVALILDVMGLAQASNVVSENRERTLSDAGKQTGTSSGEKQTVLVFQCGSGGRMAMPLSMVARLEEFKAPMVERAGDLQVVQYRGKIMPLIRVSNVLQTGNGSEQNADLSSVQVVVYSEQGRSVGLVVDRILDIVEEAFVAQQPVRRSGLLGSAVIQQRVTDLLDVRGVVRTANPSFFENELASVER